MLGNPHIISPLQPASVPPVQGGRLDFEPTFENGRCWGAFAAVQEFSRIKTDAAQPPALGICAPEDTTRPDLIRIFTDYVRSHPRSLSEQFAVIVIVSLRDRFPCAT